MHYSSPVTSGGCVILKKGLFLAFLCVFVFAMVHIGKSEDNLGCQSSLSALFETVSRWLLPRTGWLVQEFPGILSTSYLGVPRQQIHCHTTFSRVVGIQTQALTLT